MSLSREPDAEPRARFGPLLRHLRTSADLTQARLGAFLHVSPDAVATWEKGRSLPDEAIAQRLDEHLVASGALMQAWRSAQADRRADSATVGSTVGLSATTVLATSAQDAARFGSWAERLDAGDVAIAALALRVRELAHRALSAPPVDVIGPASDLARELFTLLRGHTTPARARDLYTLAGATCALVAWLSGDLGALDAAAVHASTAEVCAEHADRDELRAWVASARSKTVFWTGNYLTAARIAAAAQRFTPNSTVTVMLACQEADAYAKLGDIVRADAALERAAREADRVVGIDMIGGLLSCGPGRRAGYAATIRTVLGQHDKSLEAADWALDEFAADSRYGFGTVAQVHVTRMLAFAGIGEFDGAEAAVRPVLNLPPGRRLATITGRLRPFTRALNSPALRSSSVAAPLRAEIIEWCDSSVQRVITTGSTKEQR
jgi:transcriptional regulator with XRE-family HTH domain